MPRSLTTANRHGKRIRVTSSPITATTADAGELPAGMSHLSIRATGSACGASGRAGLKPERGAGSAVAAERSAAALNLYMAEFCNGAADAPLRRR